jgi:hypothetical protein
MSLFVSSLLLSCLLLLPPLVLDSGKVRCTCRPSPPGGVTECQSGQNAICTGSGGVCKGSCVSFSNDLRPLAYSAELLSTLFAEKVRAEDLEKDPKGSKKILDEVVKLSDNGKSGNVTFKGRTRDFCVALSKAAKDKLKSASKALAAGTLYLTVPKVRRWP